MPVQVSPTTGPAVSYTKVKLVPPPDQRPLSACKGLRFLLMFPDDPRQVTGGVSGAAPGGCVRARRSTTTYRAPAAGGAEWLDLQLGWNLVFYLQDRPSPQEAPIPPTPKPGSAEP